MKTDNQNAIGIYIDIVSMLLEKELQFESYDDDLVAKIFFTSDDFPTEFIISVDGERELVGFVAKLPFTAPKEKRVDIAFATGIANNTLLNGNFDFDYRSGEIYFRMAQSFKGGVTLTNESIEHLIYVAILTMDEFNDRFFMICDDAMTLQKFVESMEN